MKYLTQFIEESKNKTKHKIPMAYHVPTHGAHSRVSHYEEDLKKSREKIPMSTHVPTHGAHSRVSYYEKDTKRLKHKIHEEAQTQDYQEFRSHNPNPHLGNTVKDVHKNLTPSDESWSAAPEAHRNAISRYTLGSSDINNELIQREHGTSRFDPHPDDNEITRKIKKGHAKNVSTNISRLDSALRASRLPHDLTVFHGITPHASQAFNPGELAKQHPERKIGMPAYTSTTIDPKEALRYARPKTGDTHILRINMKAGQRGFKYLGDRSAYPHEKEGLLSRGRVLRIGEHPTIMTHPDHPDRKIHIWDAHLEDHE